MTSRFSGVVAALTVVLAMTAAMIAIPAGATSPSVTWTQATGTASQYWYGATYGTPGGQGIFVAVDNASGGGMGWSTDGQTWHSVTPTLAVGVSQNYGQWWQVTWTGSEFIAVSASTTHPQWATSTDGMTWEVQAAIAGTQGAGTRFLGVASSGSTIVIALSEPSSSGVAVVSDDGGSTWNVSSYNTSDDPEWLTSSGGSFQWYGNDSSILSVPVASIAANANAAWTISAPTTMTTVYTGDAANGMLIAAGYGNGSDAPVYWSTDNGATWTQATIPSLDYSDSFYGISYNSNGIWVALDYTYGHMIYSSDGKTWQSASYPGSTIRWGATASGAGTTIALDGNGGGSIYWSTLSGIQPTPPNAPSSPTATGGSGSVSVSWTPPSGTVTNYTATASAASGSKSCTSSDPTCVIEGLAACTTYSITVTATNDSGTSPASTPVSATTTCTSQETALAKTGSDLGSPLLGGLALIAGGSALAYRRRRNLGHHTLN